METKKIAMIISPKGFQDREFSIPYKSFCEENILVDVYSTIKGIAQGSAGSRVKIEKDLSELKVDDYDSIVFVGGPGTIIVRDDSRSIQIAQQAFNKDKIVAAICWSPTILAKAGILSQIKATVWNGMDKEYNMLTSKYLEEKNAIYTGKETTVDKNIITANGPMAAEEFAKAIIAKVKGS